MRIRSYDILTTTTDKITKNKGGSIKELPFNKKRMETICELIDIFIDEIEADSIGVNVDDETLDISISLACQYFEFVGLANTFMGILKDSKEVSFISPDEDHVKMTFLFNGIWE